MSTTTEYLTCADTAKMLRGALRSQFPGVKFSVRSDTYAGGASIRVYWTDGPAEDAVRALTELYRGADFDGMTDYKSYHSTLLADPSGDVREVHMGADFVFPSRTMSDEFVAACAERAEFNGRVGYPMQCEGCGDWMSERDCWTATTVERGHEHVAFCCSAKCAGRRIARYTSA